MAATLIDGKKISKKITSQLKEKVDALLKEGKRRPCLAVILVGNDSASQIYVTHKRKKCEQIGFLSQLHQLDEKTEQSSLEQLILELNESEDVDGILLQLPLPQHLDSKRVIHMIDHFKDIDGLTPYNQGLLCQGHQIHTPCTPKGIITMLDEIDCDPEGKLACVIGRSILVGGPVSQLLTKRNATVVHMHSKTKNPKSLTVQADILVVAAGVCHLVDDSWIKEGAVVIDVGIHRKEKKLVGDVDFEKVFGKASYITPVPGGVGPMTVASLMENTLKAYERK